MNYQYGFECGVKYVNGTEGMNVEVVELPSYAGTDVTGANVGGNYVVTSLMKLPVKYWAML